MKFIITVLIATLIASNVILYFKWKSDYRYGAITVRAPKKCVVEMESDEIKINGSSGTGYSLGYGNYKISIPLYHIECTVFKNHRGVVNINVYGDKEYKIDFDSNSGQIGP